MLAQKTEVQAIVVKIRACVIYFKFNRLTAFHFCTRQKRVEIEDNGMRNHLNLDRINLREKTSSSE